MALIDQTKHLSNYIESKKSYTAHNTELFDIYEGNLLPYVDQILRESLSPKYYSMIKERIYPINILQRIIDKMSRAYSHRPIRTANSNQEVLEMYETTMMMNQKMNMADEYAHLFKGYALEPFITTNGVPSLRVLPFDRFLTESDSLVDPTELTRFYKYIGKYKKIVGGSDKEVDIWFVYTAEEFVAIDNEGNIIQEFMVDQFGNQLYGENPLGFIPFYFGNRSEYKIMPTQDTDTLALSKLLPVQFSDLSGTILFQCFSIIYGIDVNFENLTVSPNAFWAFKSDPQSDKQPQLDVLTPTADVNKVLDFIREAFSTWMESKGIRVGATGQINGNFNVSGISKIIDEMDSFEAIKKQIEFFKRDEFEFWQLIKKMNNYWADTSQLKTAKLPETWAVITEFDEPKPAMSRDQEVDIVIKERDGGIISTETAIKKLYPDWTEKQVKEEMARMEQEEIGPLTEEETNGNMAEIQSQS